MRLKLVPESTSAIPGKTRVPKYLEGADATELLEAWRTHVGPTGMSWANYAPADFRQRLVDWSGADVEMPNIDDDAILEAVVKALGPEVVALEE